MYQRLCKIVLALAAGGVWLLNMARADSPAAPTDRPYQVQWIWCHVESPQPFQFVRFRKTIDVASCPESATACIAADTFYRLWINGHLVMHGPARSSRGKSTVDPVDVGRHLAPGRNALMIEVFHGVCPFEALAQSPGLLCELEADFGGPKVILAATDATWAASEITAWSRKSLKFNYQRGWTEQFDARRILEEKRQPAIVLGIRLGFPLKITPHNGGALQSCRGFITTPKGRVQVAWEVQQDRYQLRASLPKDVTAEVILPPEAKAVWQSAPATGPWRETLTVRGDATIAVAPGKVEAP